MGLLNQFWILRYSLWLEMTLNFMFLYVDDLVIGDNDSSTINCFKDYLKSCFYMKYLGQVRYFLGIKIARHPDGIFCANGNIV